MLVLQDFTKAITPGETAPDSYPSGAISGVIASYELPEPLTAARMVKKLDLPESNHGCGLNGLSREKPKTDVTQRYTAHI
jgi:hypothetical protein